MSIYKHLQLEISDEGVDFIFDWEGVELVAYKDVVGVWTIGVGHTGYMAVQGTHISRERAIELFQEDVGRYVEAINHNVSVALTQAQYDALVSLCFNIGINAFAKSNAVTGNLNAGRYEEAANGFLLWNKATDQGRLKVVEGLTNRRRAERRVFLTGEYL